MRNPAFPDAAITPRLLLTHRASLIDDESALLPGPWRTEGADSGVSLLQYVRRRLAPGSGGDGFVGHRVWSDTEGKHSMPRSFEHLHSMTASTECAGGSSPACLSSLSLSSPPPLQNNQNQQHNNNKTRTHAHTRISTRRGALPLQQRGDDADGVRARGGYRPHCA